MKYSKDQQKAIDTMLYLNQTKEGNISQQNKKDIQNKLLNVFTVLKQPE